MSVSWQFIHYIIVNLFLVYLYFKTPPFYDLFLIRSEIRYSFLICFLLAIIFIVWCPVMYFEINDWEMDSLYIYIESTLQWLLIVMLTKYMMYQTSNLSIATHSISNSQLTNLPSKSDTTAAKNNTNNNNFMNNTKRNPTAFPTTYEMEDMTITVDNTDTVADANTDFDIDNESTVVEMNDITIDNVTENSTHNNGNIIHTVVGSIFYEESAIITEELMDDITYVDTNGRPCSIIKFTVITNDLKADKDTENNTINNSVGVPQLIQMLQNSASVPGRERNTVQLRNRHNRKLSKSKKFTKLYHVLSIDESFQILIQHIIKEFSMEIMISYVEFTQYILETQKYCKISGMFA